MKKYLEILQGCPLFSQVDRENILPMLGCLNAKVVDFDRKYTIFPEGKPAKHIGIVLTGSVHIIQNDYYGNRSILSEVRSPHIFGEAFACAETQATPVAVIADEPCSIMLLDCTRLLYTCSNNCGFHQQLIFNLMKDLAEKAILFHQKLEVISRRSTREKLMTYLMLQAKKAGSPAFDIPFDRQELADYLEVERSGLSAEIGKLCREGVIETKKQHFVLL